MSTRTFALVIVTLALSLAAWGLHASRMRDEASLERGPGTVERFVSDCDTTQRRGMLKRCPTFPLVRFETADGMPHHFESNVGRGFSQLHENQSVVVLYDRRDPAGSARILDYGLPPEWLVGCAAACGLLLTALSLWFDPGRPGKRRASGTSSP